MTGRAFAHLLAALDPLARTLRGYTAYRLHRDEYIDTFPEGLYHVASILEEGGYVGHWLSAAKFHPDPHNAVHHRSLRRIPDEHPDVDARIVDEYEPNECQYHVHLWPAIDGTEIYSHYEVRGDIGLNLSRMREHYRPTWGETYLLGVTDIER